MPDALLDELRERVQLRSVLFGLGVLVVLRVALDASVAQLGTTAVTGAMLGLSEAAEDAYDLRSGVRWLSFAGVVIVSGAALLAFDDSAPWLPVAFLVIGTWILLDAVQTLRHGGITEDDDVRDGEEVYHTYVVRRVHEALDERARTRRELSESLDADDGDVDRALDTLQERGLLDRSGSELRVSSSEQGRLQSTRDAVSSGAKRLARPVRMEFEE